MFRPGCRSGGWYIQDSEKGFEETGLFVSFKAFF
jgi:hypothetical protein